MKYLVTGGAGFIGSHLTETLILANNKVIVVDDLSSGYSRNLPNSSNIVFIESKIQDLNQDHFKDINGIFHLAAQASVPKSINDFYNSSRNNLLGTIKVFDLANKLNIPVVYATSSAVYGNFPLGNDQIEKFEILSPYAQDKLTMENYAKMAWNVYKTRSLGLRFFNVYGPRQDPTNPYSGVISIFIDRLSKALPITVNGGYQTRDFIFVKDVVDVMIKSMNILEKKSLYKVFNVGTGVSISIDTLLTYISEIIKVKPIITMANLPLGDPERSEGTFKELERVVGLSLNKFYTLQRGLEETIQYYHNLNNNKNG
jgi:UDP-glucose 4-epimerase